MDVEQQLRVALARQVSAPPALPGLADRVVRRSRRVRRVRVAAAAAAVAVVALGAATVVEPVLERRNRSTAPADPDGAMGPPRVSLRLGTSVVDWPRGVQRVRKLDGALPLAEVPAGLLVQSPPAGLVVQPGDPTQRRVLVAGQVSPALAVTPDGRRVTVVSGEGTRRRLQELDVATGRVLRSLPVGPPLAARQERVLPVGYSGGAVLLTVGQGASQHAAVWEAGADGVVDGVVRALDRYTSALGGARSTEDRPEEVSGLGAFTLRAGGRCGTEVAGLRTGARGWTLCDETFVSFSPDRRYVLALTPAFTPGDVTTQHSLVVHDARDGAIVRRVAIPPGPYRAVSWEGSAALLQSTREGSKAVVLRCVVRTGACRAAVDMPYTGLPVPVPRFGA